MMTISLYNVFNFGLFEYYNGCYRRKTGVDVNQCLTDGKFTEQI